MPISARWRVNRRRSGRPVAAAVWFARRYTVPSRRDRQPVAMTIAGSDSGGGAGIQADLKTFQALGVYGASALTAITAQNTIGVTAVYEIPTEVIAAQMDSVAADIWVDAAKTGMLSSADIIAVVAERIRHWRINQL